MAHQVVGASWTDPEALGSIGAAVVALAALITTVVLTVLDRRKAASNLLKEHQRNEQRMREERAYNASEQLRIFYLQSLLRLVDLRAEIEATKDQGTSKQAELALRALLLVLPADVATLVRFQYESGESARSKETATSISTAYGRELRRPVPTDWIHHELEDNIKRFLPGATATPSSP